MSTTLKRFAVRALVTLGFVFAGQAHAAQASAAAINMDVPGEEFNYVGYTIGFRFSLVSDALVTSLGFYDSLRDGLAGPAQVAIWDAGGRQLISATIPSGTVNNELDGYFRYVSIAPSFLLLAGTQYIIGAYGDADNDSSLFNPLLSLGMRGSGSVNLNLVLIRNQYAEGDGLSFPNLSDGENLAAKFAWLGPNFRMTAPIPEPETYQMLVLGLLAITALVLRRRQQD